ncbi:MAG: sigma-70 family RNA polymerase sigma factor [Clostridia bacterium]|nr:sigma-70 family RNA polymerase sigma factor [Clostridia bacterium]
MADFEETYREYEQMIQAFLLRLCGNAHLAEEVTQETFYQAFRHWGEFRGQSSVSTWLCTIAKRQLYNAVRRKEALPLEEAVHQSAADVTDALVDSDRMMAAHRLVHRLPEPMREVFTLRTFGDLSHGQIGSLFGKSDSWARVTYYRARQLLNHMAKEEWMNEE